MCSRVRIICPFHLRVRFMSATLCISYLTSVSGKEFFGGFCSIVSQFPVSSPRQLWLSCVSECHHTHWQEQSHRAVEEETSVHRVFFEPRVLLNCVWTRLTSSTSRSFSVSNRVHPRQFTSPSQDHTQTNNNLLSYPSEMHCNFVSNSDFCLWLISIPFNWQERVLQRQKKNPKHFHVSCYHEALPP